MIEELYSAWKTKDARELLRVVKFGLVGGAGVIVNTAALWVLTQFIGLHYLVAALIATETAIVANFIGNHNFTFADDRTKKSLRRRFFSFQLVSLVTLSLTLLILFLFTSAFGERFLLVWNLIAILLTFLVNYELNKRFTWVAAGTRPSKKSKKLSEGFRTTSLIVCIIAFAALLVGVAVAEPIVSTSRLGYHPDSDKQVVVYTLGEVPVDDFSTFTVYKGGNVAFSGNLTIPTDNDGDPVTCQGGLVCLVGDFSALSTAGTYDIEIVTSADSLILESAPFVINSNVYQSNLAVFDAFFDAQEQVGSSFHADYHEAQSPPFTLWADGSPIMEADQASQTLIRLGYAYRENPSVFDGDLRRHVLSYARFLRGLQNVQVQEIPFGAAGWEDGFRIDSTMQVNNVFVVGPTQLTTFPVYQNTNGVQLAGSPYPVTSICEDLNPSCVSFAADVYKCQVGEPCLNVSYVGPTGRITTDANNYRVRMGWNYEFACDLDISIDSEMFDEEKNPCLIFRDDDDIDFTIRALHAYLAALPAMKDANSNFAQDYWYQALRTYRAIEDEVSSGDDLASWGAVNFLMYEITGNEDYLEVAFDLEDQIDQSFNSYISDGREFYWTQHALMRDDMIDAGFSPIDSPEQIFQGQMFFDWKDRGIFSIDQTGERVFQLFRDAEFQNSRPMLIQSVLASKTQLLDNDPEPFTQTIADAQLAWLTGTNAVQSGVSANDRDLRSYSFILGIGEDINPEEFHSRLLIDTGHRERTNDEFVGARGTGYWWRDSQGTYHGYDGVTRIINTPLGATGNGQGGEVKINKWDVGRTFANGEDTIPGWIVGPYEWKNSGYENDVIYNYNDDLTNFRFTETTNEMVAIAMQALALRDRILNDKSPHPGVTYNEVLPTVANATISVTATPPSASIYLDGEDSGLDGSATFSVVPGSHSVSAVLDGYETQTRFFDNLASGQSVSSTFTLLPQEEFSTLTISTTPGSVNYAINSQPPASGTTSAAGQAVVELAYGNYTLSFSKSGYTPLTRNVVVDQPVESLSVVLVEENAAPANLTVVFTPVDAIVAFDGGEVPSTNGQARILNIEPGEHTLSVINGVEYEPFGPETITIAGGSDETITINLLLRNATFDVSSTPTNADVYLNNVFVGVTNSQIEYPAGNYTARFSLAGYSDFTSQVSLLSGQTTTLSHNFAPTSGSLRVFSRAGANIVIDETFVGSVNSSGVLIVDDVQTGSRRVEASLSGYNTNVKRVDVVEGVQTDVNLPLTLSIAGTTDLPGSPHGSTYFLREDRSGSFNVDLPANQSVQWRVLLPSGEVVAGGPDVTLPGNATFTWNPGIMWTPRIPPEYDTIEAFVVQATTGSAEARFSVDVENIINPFSTNIGDLEARFQVFTNDKFVSFTDVFLTINRDDGGDVQVKLVPEGAGNNETDWKIILGDEVLGYGSNRMTQVTGYPSGLNSTPIVYQVVGRDAYFERESSGSPGGSSGGGRSGGSSGGTSSSSDDDVGVEEESFELVVLTVSDDVIEDDESITITADVRGEGTSEASFVNVILRHPAGWARTEPLRLVSGSAGYGTWETEVSSFLTGQYVVETVRVRGDSFEWTELDVDNRGFYVVGEDVAAGESLALVYTTLSESLLADPGIAIFRLDARDEIGIDSIEMEIQPNRGGELMRVAMERVSGNPQYGTWEGLINASQEDTTYTVQAVTLVGQSGTRRLEIPDRQVYVSSPTQEELEIRRQQENLLTGNVGAESPVSAARMREFLSQPMVPALLAFLVVILIVAAVFFTPLRNKFRQR